MCFITVTETLRYFQMLFFLFVSLMPAENICTIVVVFSVSSTPTTIYF